MSLQLYLRVNGVEIDSLKIRRKMVSGAPIGDREFVISDPLFGKFSIDDTFILEVRADRRRKWKVTSITELFEMIGRIPSFQL